MATAIKTMRLEYRHNNAYDMVVLVDPETGLVRSDWAVDRSVIEDFATCTQDAADWDGRGGDVYQPDEYGELIAVREGYGLTVVDAKRWPERVEFFCH